MTGVQTCALPICHAHLQPGDFPGPDGHAAEKELLRRGNPGGVPLRGVLLRGADRLVPAEPARRRVSGGDIPGGVFGSDGHWTDAGEKMNSKKEPAYRLLLCLES